MGKIKFYSLGSEKLDLLKNNGLKLDTSKVILTAPGFNNAMQSVIKKDIKGLDKKLEKIIKDINFVSTKNGINIKLNPCFDMSNIDQVIDIIEQSIKALIIENGKNRVGVFSLNKIKKRLKRDQNNELIDLLTRSNTILVTMKKEYEKLLQRKKVVKQEEEVETKKVKEDPLERTINFYINKNK